MTQHRARHGLLRTRWAAIGAAMAVSLGAGGIGISHATTSTGEKPIYLPIEPCRLADTRPAFNVGTRATPLGAAETYDIAGWGSVGNCTLPTNTAGLALNVTAIDPSAPTFLTLFPDGTTLPLASHLNPTPGQPPTPNAVNVDLSAAGNFSIYNLAGNVHIAIDVVGIYDDHNHDDRYYTETEVDAALATKADLSKVTVLGYNGSNTEASPIASYELIRTVGVVNKVSADTALHLDWSAHHRYTGTDGSDFCHYQLRIDGRANDGDNALNYQGDQEGNAVSYAANAPLSTFAIFPGISAGNHTVQIYVRGNADSCTLNFGNFNQQVIVEEFPVTTSSDLSSVGTSNGATGGGG